MVTTNLTYEGTGVSRKSIKDVFESNINGLELTDRLLKAIESANHEIAGAISHKEKFADLGNQLIAWADALE